VARAERVPPRRLLALARRIWERDEGAELVELVVVLPFLLIMSFGILELGNALDKAHGMATLSREGANIAVRGTALDTVVSVTMSNGVSIGLDARGGTIASRILVEGGVPTLKEQVATSGYVGLSRVGQVDSTVSQYSGAGLVDGQQLFAVEIFYDHQKVTPLSRVLAPIIPDTMYDVSVF
jgi:Flp pilus assembly protein TadG